MKNIATSAAFPASVNQAPKAKTRSFATRMTNRLWLIANRLIPQNRTGDRLYSWLSFLRYQRRWPQPKRMWFNDVLYVIQSTDEIVDPLRIFTTDKEFVKLYVGATVGDAYNVPTLAVLRSLDECRRYEFPLRCVIKPTHLSGAVVLRRAGEPIDLNRIASWFQRDFGADSREANYRPLRPKVIVEPFVFEDDNPNDYKVFCVGGEPKMIQVDSDRHTFHTRTMFDTDWGQLPYAFIYPTTNPTPVRPANLSAMLDAARQLSARFNFVRVDFYSNGQEMRVGELTHCPENVRGQFIPRGSEAAASALLFGGKQKA